MKLGGQYFQIAPVLALAVLASFSLTGCVGPDPNLREPLELGVFVRHATFDELFEKTQSIAHSLGGKPLVADPLSGIFSAVFPLAGNKEIPVVYVTFWLRTEGEGIRVYLSPRSPGGSLLFIPDFVEHIEIPFRERVIE